MRRPRAALPLLLAAVAAGAPAAGQSRPGEEAAARATFALVIGVNRGVDPELPVLRYADDDAARYQELFRSLGARTYLLTRADDNTRHLHPQAVAEAQEPREAVLARVVAQLAADVAQARARSIATTLYVIYAGHGDVRDGEGYVSLEDGRLTGRRLAREVVGAVHADESHLVVDACHSYFLVFGRGPGGARRPLRGFLPLDEVLPRNVGLLFSTSSARESHEWDAFEAGVFSHEVRSGLAGAADVNNDGLVSYREIAAFVDRANTRVLAERYRPDVYARPPEGHELFHLRTGLRRRLELDGTTTGHLFLEDGRGVRVADLHNAPGQRLQIVRPPPSGRGLFLRRDGEAIEASIPLAPDVVEVASLEWGASATAQRGGAHETFRQLFAVPFDRAAADEYRFRPLRPPEVWLGRGPAAQRRLVAGGVLTALSAAALLGGLAATLQARALRDGTPAGATQPEVAARNGQIAAWNGGAGASYALLGVTLAASVVLFAWPPERVAPRLTVAAGPGAASMSMMIRF